MFSSCRARTSFVDMKASLSCIGAALISGSGLRSALQRLAPILGAALLTACTQAHLATNKSGIVSPSRQRPRIESRYIVRAKETRGRGKKAHSFCIEQESRRDKGCIARNCQLLHGRNKDCVRREVRYARINGRTSHVAVRHSVARDERRKRQSVMVRVNDRVHTSAAGLLTCPTLRPKRWEWLEAVSQRSNLTSSNSRHDQTWT